MTDTRIDYILVLPLYFQFHFLIEYSPYDMILMHNITRIMHQALEGFSIFGKLKVKNGKIFR